MTAPCPGRGSPAAGREEPGAAGRDPEGAAEVTALGTPERETTAFESAFEVSRRSLAESAGIPRYPKREGLVFDLVDATLGGSDCGPEFRVVPTPLSVGPASVWKNFSPAAVDLLFTGPFILFALPAECSPLL